MKVKKEETIILDLLSKYKYLNEAQIVRYIKYLSPEVVQRMLGKLVNNKIIFYNEETLLYSSIPIGNPDNNLLKAFWVLLQFTGRIKHENHFPADFPSQILFLKDNSEYEIVVIETGFERTLSVLTQKNKLNEEDPIKYIIVIDDESQIEKCVKILPDIPLLFAIVKYNEETYTPNVNFYKTNPKGENNA